MAKARPRGGSVECAGCDYEEGLCAAKARQRAWWENFHWSQARKHTARMAEGSHFGKVVLSLNWAQACNSCYFWANVTELRGISRVPALLDEVS